MSESPQKFPLTPIYDQLLREQDQSCPPTRGDTAEPDQPASSEASDTP